MFALFHTYSIVSNGCQVMLHATCGPDGNFSPTVEVKLLHIIIAASYAGQKSTFQAFKPAELLLCATKQAATQIQAGCEGAQVKRLPAFISLYSLALQRSHCSLYVLRHPPAQPTPTLGFTTRSASRRLQHASWPAWVTVLREVYTLHDTIPTRTAYLKPSP